MDDECRVLFGKRGSGKSTTLLTWILDEAQKGSAILLCCPEPQLIEACVAHLSAMGMEDRIILDYADPRRAGGRFPQWPLIQTSGAQDPLVRFNQNELFLDHFVNLGFTTRQIKDGSLNPTTYKYARAGGKLMQGLPGVPARLLLKLMDPGNDEGLWLLANTGNQDAADEFRLAFANARGKPSFYYSEVGPFLRMFSFLDLVSLWTHDGATFSWKSVIRKQKIYLLDLSGVSTAARKTLGMSAYTNAIHAMRELFDEDGEPHPFLLCLDEFGALDWMTPLLVGATQEDRKRGFKGFYATQTPEDVQPPEIMKQILGLTDHYWHLMASGTDIAAEDIISHTFDAHKELNRTEQQLNDGFEEIRTETSAEHEGHTLVPSSDPLKAAKKHKSKSQSTTEHVSFRPKFRTVINVKEMSPAVQLHEAKTQVSSHPVGRFTFVGSAGVSVQTTIPPGEPWILGNEFLPSRGMTLYEVRLQEAIERIRRRKIYQPPREWQPPSTPAGQGMR
jgi:hypothetical protein